MRCKYRYQHHISPSPKLLCTTDTLIRRYTVGFVVQKGMVIVVVVVNFHTQIHGHASGQKHAPIGNERIYMKRVGESYLLPAIDFSVRYYDPRVDSRRWTTAPLVVS